MAKTKKKTGPKVGTGHAKFKIDQATFEKLCALQPTQVEIAVFFGVSVDTLDRWCKKTYDANFAEVFSQKRTAGHLSLRRKQFESAMSGDKALQIWLGKQWLGQTDKQELSSNTKKPFVLAYKLDDTDESKSE